MWIFDSVCARVCECEMELGGTSLVGPESGFCWRRLGFHSQRGCLWGRSRKKVCWVSGTVTELMCGRAEAQTEGWGAADQRYWLSLLTDEFGGKVLLWAVDLGVTVHLRQCQTSHLISPPWSSGKLWMKTAYKLAKVLHNYHNAARLQRLEGKVNCELENMETITANH